MLQQVSKKTEKEIVLIKIQSKYLALINTKDELYICPETYESPLVASNAARALKKQYKIKKGENTDVVPSKPKKPTKIAKVKPLYTEEEMSSRPHLKFREVWVILSPRGEFVEKAIEDATLVHYQKDCKKAEIFKSYEDALFKLKTLDMVVKKGHYLRRFFEEVK